MPRLFTTPRELDYFSHISKEITKDINGQKIYYYAISIKKTQVHDVYEEATDKIYEDPIEIECWVNWMEPEVYTGQFGVEYRSKLECLIQNRDLIDKEIDPKEGSFFTYGSLIFEITSAIKSSIIHGQVEHANSLKLTGLQSRKSQFKTKVFGPTDERHSDEDATQKDFVQQRGFAENRLGPTNDSRELLDQGVIENDTIDAPAEVSPRGKNVIGSNSDKSSFYGDDDS